MHRLKPDAACRGCCMSARTGHAPQHTLISDTCCLARSGAGDRVQRATWQVSRVRQWPPHAQSLACGWEVVRARMQPLHRHGSPGRSSPQHMRLGDAPSLALRQAWLCAEQAVLGRTVRRERRRHAPFQSAARATARPPSSGGSRRRGGRRRRRRPSSAASPLPCAPPSLPAPASAAISALITVRAA